MDTACLRPSGFTRPDGAHYTQVLEEITDEYDLDVSFDDYRADKGDLPDADEAYDAVVVTGSGAHVYDQQDWVADTERYLEQALEDDTPVLGICYGHQILADTLGADEEQTVQALKDSDDVPGDREMGYSDITVTEDGKDHPLFDGILEDGEDVFVSFTSHQDRVTELPENAVEIAQNEYGVHAYAAEDVPAYGIQFHPEYSLDMAVKLVMDKGLSPEQASQTLETFTPENVIDTETSRNVLKNFFQHLC